MTGEALLAVAVPVGGAVYVAACAYWPYMRCPRCEGAGKFPSPSGRYWRNCRRCKGKGARLRLGRRVWNYFARTRAGAGK